MARVITEKIVEAMQQAMYALRFRDIFGFGMIMVGLMGAWHPAGSIQIAQDIFDFPILVHTLWFALSGFALTRWQWGVGMRYILISPMLMYIAFTFAWVLYNWHIANPVVVVNYVMLYLVMVVWVSRDDD